MEAIGGSLDEYDDFFCLDTPAGYVWRATGEPAMTIHWASRSETWLTKAIKDETENLRMGLEKVTDAERLKEIQWNLGDDDWAAKPDAPAHLDFAP